MYVASLLLLITLLHARPPDSRVLVNVFTLDLQSAFSDFSRNQKTRQKTNELCYNGSAVRSADDPGCLRPALPVQCQQQCSLRE